MENASKALIIAGAILLAILIIGIGMAVYNVAAEPAKKINLNQYEIMVHNQRYEDHAGKVKGSRVKTLLSNIIGNTDENYPEVTVTWAGGSLNNAGRADVNNISKASAQNVKVSDEYTVELEYTDGMVDHVIITP